MAREEPSAKSAPSLLLALPDPCLLAVLQCCAADGQRSLFSAARAHSRLHQAAVLAFNSLSIHCKGQQQADSILMFLGKHEKEIGSVQLTADDIYDCSVFIRELPPSLQPSRLQLTGFRLQLQPGDGFLGVLGVAAQVEALKQLELKLFELEDGDEGLAAALTQLPTGLGRLCIASEDDCCYTTLSISALQHLQQLTSLKLANFNFVDNHKVGPTLQAMTRLVDLRLHYAYAADDDHSPALTAGVLSGMSHLTRLELFGQVEPGVLASQTQLHHLEMQDCLWCWRQSGAYYAPGHSNPILELQRLQQLTHLSVSCASNSWIDFPAATVSALTVSSKLQHLGISGALPVGTWQVLFPVGRQLPNLRALDISGAYEKSRSEAVPTSRLDCSCIISCCPGLLSVGGLRWKTIWEDMGRFVERTLQSDMQAVECTLKIARQQEAMRTETYQLATQVSDLLTEVAHLRLQLSKQQGQQQAAAFKGAALQASTELMPPEAAALQLAAAEAQAAAAEARAAAAEARAAAAEARAVLAEAQLATGSGPADAVAAARHLRKVAEVCAVGAAGAVRVDDREENW